MPSRFLLALAALASTCWIGMGQALAENRLALVIGNSDYTSVTVLPNPANDAKAMTEFLTSAGFEVVQAPNLTQSAMRQTIGAFASRVAEKGPDTVALVFYAGHGLQVDGENFLVPVDAQIEREADVALQSMRLADIMNALSSVPSKIRLVILDACRNNPFSAINKTTGRGLAIVDAPNGSLVSYSTAPGTEALDGDGVNSPFTSSLVQIGKEPGLPIEQVLKRVRLAVSGATNQQQFPWESSSLTGEFSFIPGAAGQDRPAMAGTDKERPTIAGVERERPTKARAGQERVRIAASSRPSAARIAREEARMTESLRKELRSKTPRDAYEWVILEDRVEVYEAYLAVYPSQSMAPIVRSLLDRRETMIAWYNAVTLNTIAGYEAFLASYGNSDFAATANRLLERARSRAIANAGSAFAYGPACPCNVVPIRREKRTNLAPTRTNAPNPTSTAAVPPAAAAGAPTAPTDGVGVYDPPPVTVYTDPTPPILPPVVVPIDPRPPHVSVPPRQPKDGHDQRPEPSGHDKTKSTGPTHDPPPPSGRGKQKPTGISSVQPSGSSGDSAGHDKAKPSGTSTRTPPSGHDKVKFTPAPKQDYSRHTRGRIHDTPRIRIKENVVHAPAKARSFTPVSAARVAPRISHVPRQPLGFGGMVRNAPMGGMMPRISSGRMGGGHVATPRAAPGRPSGGFGRIMGFGR
jgi:uncharacterized caspase-like protein